MLLSRSQSFEYVRREGLQKLTNVTAHDWDLYVLKELVDNGLDADEAFSVEAEHSPSISVEMRYAGGGLELQVRNRAAFPMSDIRAIFDVERRVSVKDYYNRPTRGAQGNALKTLLGIPYALWYHYFASYPLHSDAAGMKPLTIASGDQQADLYFDVDECEQTVSLRPINFTRPIQFVHGTEVCLNIYRFLQEYPRTADTLLTMARSFAIWNPHASFDFAFVVRDQLHTFTRPAHPDLRSFALKEPSPVSWYTYAEFRELLHALLRSSQEHNASALLLGDIAAEFGITTMPAVGAMHASTPLRDLLDGASLRPDATANLFTSWLHACAQVPQPTLRALGAEVMCGEGEWSRNASGAGTEPEAPTPPRLMFYEDFSEVGGVAGASSPLGARTTPPFTVEVSLVPSDDGRRQIHTGINYTPTYRDPFFNKPLIPPGTDEVCLGLDKLLDHCNIRDTVGVTLSVHLTAPAVVYENYGKSAINDEPYRAHVAELVQAVASRYTAATRPQPEADVMTPQALLLLPSIVASLSGMPITETQLMGALKRALHAQGDASLDAVLISGQADSRLRSAIAAYQATTPIPGFIQRQIGRLVLPQHPADMITIQLHDQPVLGEMLDKSGVRAIVIAGRTELEDLLVALQLPLRFDVALLRTEGNFTAAVATLAQMLPVVGTRLLNQPAQSAMPLWMIRDASIAGALAPYQVREALIRESVMPECVIDLGLRPDDAIMSSLWVSAADTDDGLLVDSQTNRERLRRADVPEAAISFYVDERQTAKLDTLASGDFLEWWEDRLNSIGAHSKLLPDARTIASSSLETVRETLRREVERSAFTTLELDAVLASLTRDWDREMQGWVEQLHRDVQERLQVSPLHSWRHEADEATKALLQRFMTNRRVEAVRDMIRAER